jgi:hypothetical protein
MPGTLRKGNALYTFLPLLATEIPGSDSDNAFAYAKLRIDDEPLQGWVLRQVR